MTNSEALSVVLVGGSGFLGRALRDRLLARGDSVTVIGRGPSGSHGQASTKWRSVSWEPSATALSGNEEWVEAINGSDVIVHLAGKRVDCRPTRANIDELISSREGTVQLVSQARRLVENPPQTWIQLSSLAIFGDSGDEEIRESTPPPTTGIRQQVEVCRRWEAAYEEATTDMDRRVLLRPAIGIGGSGDPATKQLTRLAKLGFGGSMAGGSHWVSWIDAEDLIDLLLRSVVDTTMSGLYHLAAPEPVRNEAFMAAYRNAVGRRFGLKSPAQLVKLGAALLGSDPGLALTGRRCVPGRLLDEDYDFKHTDIAASVRRAVTQHQ